MNIKELLDYTNNNNASDLHLIPNQPPTVRVDGDIKPLRVQEISAEGVLSMLYSIMTEKQKEDFDIGMELDFAITSPSGDRFRVNAFHTLSGVAAAFRRIPSKILSLEEISSPPIIKSLSTLHKGLILVTGPTGSGKTTTIAAMIKNINDTMPKHILTIEDPIEFIHKSNRAIINQREVGSHTNSFKKAIKSAMREDPDVILVGELRDLETINLAITAAETGHLVLATLHTSSAPKTVDRIVDVFPPHDKETVRSMLSSSLQAVITQKLIKRSDGNGRVAAHEIMVVIPAIANLIRENKIPQVASMMQVNRSKGMQTMKDAVYELLEQGIISHDEARKVLDDAEDSDSMPKAGSQVRRPNSNMGGGSSINNQF